MVTMMLLLPPFYRSGRTVASLAGAMLLLLAFPKDDFAFAQDVTTAPSSSHCDKVQIVLDDATQTCTCQETTATSSSMEDDVITIAAIYDMDKWPWGSDVVDFVTEQVNARTTWRDDLLLQLPSDVVRLEVVQGNSGCDERLALTSYYNLQRHYALDGVVGARCSGATTSIARLATLEQVPQISIWSTSAKLSDKEAFPYLSRTVGPDNAQAQVGGLVSMLRLFGWERMTILNTDTAYAKDVVPQVKQLWLGDHDDASGKWTGQVGHSDTVRVQPDGSLDPNAILQVLDAVPTHDPGTNARVILLVAHYEHAHEILRLAHATNFQPDTIWVDVTSWVHAPTWDHLEKDLPEVPGYLGLMMYYNRNDYYTDFLERMREWQAANGKEVWQELPSVIVEYFVDCILALVQAVVQGRVHGGSSAQEITNHLRALDFQGVSGRVQFTPEGDRKDPLYIIGNMQRKFGKLVWNEVGTTGTEIGSAKFKGPSYQYGLEEVCFAQAGCRLNEPPSDRYPEPLLPWWAWVLILVPVLLFIVVVIKYWRSRRSKHSLKEELQALKDSVVGMRAVKVDYIPSVMTSNGAVGASIIANGSVLKSRKSFKHSSKASQSSDDLCDSIPLNATLKSDPSGVAFDVDDDVDLVDVDDDPRLKTTLHKKSSSNAATVPLQVQWCWEETKGSPMDRWVRDSPDQIFGNPDDCWIQYSDDCNSKLEAAYEEQGQFGIFSPMLGYTVDFGSMTQTKEATGFVRQVKRVIIGDSNPKTMDLSQVHRGHDFPYEDLQGEPQVVLVKGDVIQISKQRPDGWAFGTKLHHADEAVARKLQEIAIEGADTDDANILTDTGWFPLNATELPSADDLAVLQKRVGDVGALEPPDYWDPVADPTVVQKHELGKNDPEYDAVVKSFVSTFSTTTKIRVLKVERIQNLAMYQSYVVKRQTICYREIGKIDSITDDMQRKALERFERRWLWHGTNLEVVDKILQQGFNRSFCGKNATMYGKGVYFARDAKYSADRGYSVPDRQNNQYVLACRVVVGEYCVGQRDALTPAVRDQKSQSLYDTTVGLLNNDTLARPSIYVTYHDAQAYPEYLIKFRKS